MENRESPPADSDIRRPDSDIEAEIRRQMLAEAIKRRQEANAESAGQTERPSARASDKPSYLRKMQSKGGIVGTIATVLLAMAKFLSPLLLVLGKLKLLLVGLKALTFGKLFITGGSMLLSIGLEAYYYGLPMAIGIVLMIFVHESGHALAGRICGRPMGAMVFIPFMGAFVTLKGGLKNIVEDAFVGIMGPIAGTVYGLVSLAIFFATGSPFWLTLTSITFAINLFNLIPTVPLDGGWIAPLFSPKLLAVGAIMILPLMFLNPMIGILAFLSFPRIIQGWKADPKTQPYYHAPKADRIKYGITYLALAVFLALGVYFIHSYRLHGLLPVA